MPLHQLSCCLNISHSVLKEIKENGQMWKCLEQLSMKGHSSPWEYQLEVVRQKTSQLELHLQAFSEAFNRITWSSLTVLILSVSLRRLLVRVGLEVMHWLNYADEDHVGGWDCFVKVWKNMFFRVPPNENQVCLHAH